MSIVSLIALLLLLIATSGLAFAGPAAQAGEVQAPSQPSGDVENYFPVQGKLTDASGVPLNGDFSLTFRLYNTLTGGTRLCDDTNVVKVVNGLFSTEVWGECQDYIKGAQLYLSIEVGTSGELTPRQPIYAVPYAWSLRPGAIVSGSIGPGAMLHLENTDPGGRGLRVYELATSGVNYAIVGAAKSPDGVSGYFYHTGGGVAVRGESDTGAALEATGSGIIKSSALTYIWISGNGVRPYNSFDPTIINMNSTGGAKIFCGDPCTTNRNVILPITVPGMLYGQKVSLTGLQIKYWGNTVFDGITAVLLRRQNGMCSAASCYVSLVNDPDFYDCEDSAHPTGCTLNWSFTDSYLSPETTGILYLTIEMEFNGPASWVEIGGVRLTLKHQ